MALGESLHQGPVCTGMLIYKYACSVVIFMDFVDKYSSCRCGGRLHWAKDGNYLLLSPPALNQSLPSEESSYSVCSSREPHC